MLQLLPIAKLIGVIAGIYALAALSLYLILEEYGIWMRPMLSMTGAALVELLLLGFVYAGWRRLWARVPVLNRWIYPDLNGRWFATIDWVSNSTSGRATGAVHITQSLLKMSIEMCAEHSDSRTIALCVRRDQESERPLIHYIYEVTEKHKSPGQNGVYRGAASLQLDAFSLDHLNGNYFTSRGTGGHFKFSRQ